MPTLPNMSLEPPGSSPHIPTEAHQSQAAALPTGLLRKGQLPPLPGPQEPSEPSCYRGHLENLKGETSRNLSQGRWLCWRMEQAHQQQLLRVEKAHEHQGQGGRLQLTAPASSPPSPLKQPWKITLIKAKVWAELTQLRQQNLFTLIWGKNDFITLFVTSNSF